MKVKPKGSASPQSSSSVEHATRFGARSVLAAVALALVAVPFALVLLLVEDKWPPLLQADVGTSDSLHGYAVTHAGFVRAMQLVSDSGSALAWVVVLAAVVVWLLWRRLPILALFVVITGIGSSLLNTVVKSSVHRLRPVLTNPVAHEPGLSFPSGHAQAAIVGYSVLLLVFLPVMHGAWRKAGIALAVLMVLAIGFSRIALGVHYLSDVLGGFVLGGAWVAAMAAAFNALRVERGRRPVDLSEGLEPEQSPRLAGKEPKDVPDDVADEVPDNDERDIDV
ncbi:MAG: phosphatase PAP2 family protein [Dermatophilaceae bacterium]